MSSQQLQFYEQKIISDKEFPIEVFMNQVQDKCQYFHTHWHEHIELHYVVHGETDILLNQTRSVPFDKAILLSLTAMSCMPVFATEPR